MIPATNLRAFPPQWKLDEPQTTPAASAPAETGPVWSAIVRKPSAVLHYLTYTRWLRHAAWLVPLLLCAAFAARGLTAAGAARFFSAQNQSLAAFLASRATVDVGDDFRSGLSQWAGEANWSKSWSYDDIGLLHPGDLALLQNTQGLSNYRFEFEGEIEKHALGWVYRASDTRNYYAAKLVAIRHGNNPPTLALERWTVIHGRGGPHLKLPLPVLPGNTTMHRVATEVRESQFTTYLDDRIVDTWSDTRLAQGGIGFFNDPGDSAGLSRVLVTDRDTLWGRLCAQLSSKLADQVVGGVHH
jgi:hypothetical protein